VIRLANAEDAHLIHQIMVLAFEEYRNMDVPSSALNETVSSIEESLKTAPKKPCFALGMEFQLVL
jgi:hypothetical protein